MSPFRLAMCRESVQRRGGLAASPYPGDTVKGDERFDGDEPVGHAGTKVHLVESVLCAASRHAVERRTTRGRKSRTPWQVPPTLYEAQAAWSVLPRSRRHSKSAERC